MDIESISATHSVFINDGTNLSDDHMEEDQTKEAASEKLPSAPTFELMVYKEDECDGAANEPKDPLGQQEVENDSSIDYYSSDGLLKRIKLEKVKLIQPDKEKEDPQKVDEVVNDKTETEAVAVVDIYSPTAGPKTKQKLKGLTCFACKELFTDTNLFKDHLTTHSDEENIFCTECKKGFKSIHGLIFHVNNHSSKIEKNNEVPNDKASIDNLLSMMKGPYICKICRTKCWDIATFKNHVAVHTSKEKTYECNKCKRVFLNLKKLMNHVCQPIPKQRPERAERPERAVAFVNPKADFVKSPVRSPAVSKTNNDDSYYTYNPPPFATGEYHNTCFKCCQSFNDYYDLKVHVATCEGLYKCPPCQKAFMLEYKLLCHTQFHKILRPFQCDKCNLEFLSLNSFKIHLIGHGSCDYYQCMLCEKRFEHKGSLIYHSFGHMEKNFVCSYCGKEYDRQTEMQYHKVRMHSKTDKTYRCSHCHEQLSNSIRLRQHVAKFHKRKGSKFFKCEECDQTFLNSFNLERHKMTNHPPADGKKEKFLQCDICYKKFLKLEILETHRLYHNENLLDCEFCGRKFLDEYQLNLHVCQENKNKVYKCALCDKEFPRPTALGSHMRGHRNEELKRLALEANSAAAGEPKMKVELGEGSTSATPGQEREKVYECKVCNRIFFRLTALRSHMRVHGDEDGVEDMMEPTIRERGASLDETPEPDTSSSEVKPYQCKVCHRYFAKATGLGSHLRIHKADGTYVEHEQREYENFEQREYDTLETLPVRKPVKVNHSTPLPSPSTAKKPDKKFECPECGKVYNQPHFLGSHMRLHRNEKVKVPGSMENSQSGNETMNSSNLDEFKSDFDESMNSHEEDSAMHEERNHNRNPEDSEVDPDMTGDHTNDLNETSESAANDSTNSHYSSYTKDKLASMKGPNGRYYCSYCNKPFFRPAALGSHLRVHRYAKTPEQPEVQKEEIKEEEQKLDNHENNEKIENSENNESEKMEVDSTSNHVESSQTNAEPIASN